MNKVVFNEKKLDYFSKEAYRSLRSAIQFCGDDVKAIAVTSCYPNEGKTTICAELSKSLAEVGKKVLFVDADMRNSSVISKYITSSSAIIGLSQYLSGQASLSDVLYSTDKENLFAVFSGAFPPNPAELLSGKRFAEFIETAEQSFDYIVVDTPPLGLVTDASVVANVCKNAVLVIGADAVKSAFAQEVKASLERSGCRILGAVLNNLSSTKDKKYYRTEKYAKYTKYTKYKK